MKRIYLDHGATTPVDAAVADVMMQYYTEKYGNPSSIHACGRETRQALEEARRQVADLISASPQEITFTSGGTEADNLAILGTAQIMGDKGNHLITSAIEHHAVLESCEYLANNGFELTVIPVDEEGIVSAEDVRNAIRPETILISIMHANNEVGSIQPIAEIGDLAREHGVLFHVDAVQSLGKIPINLQELKVDLLTVSAHKVYGPKGVGALYVRRGVRIAPLVHGGSQEKRRRPGTENTPGIIGFGKACAILSERMEADNAWQRRLRDKLMNGVLERVGHVKINGPQGDRRLSNNINFSFQHVDGESLLLSLDKLGIAVSGGAACTSGSLGPSHVLLAMGLDHKAAHGSLRFSLGRQNTEEEIDYVLAELPKTVERLR